MSGLNIQCALPLNSLGFGKALKPPAVSGILQYGNIFYIALFTEIETSGKMMHCPLGGVESRVVSS